LKEHVQNALIWLAATAAIVVGLAVLASVFNWGASDHHHRPHDQSRHHDVGSGGGGFSGGGSGGFSGSGGGGFSSGFGEGGERLDPIQIEDTLVMAYCSYSPASSAQEQGCEDHVTADYILGLDTPAAVAARDEVQNQYGDRACAQGYC
jgi:hypothetical protein